MKQYLDLMRHIRDNGTVKTDRTGTGTKSIFGHQMRFNLQEGFPLVTTKKVFMKAVIHELLWFLQGSTNVKYLQENGVTIWDEWAKVDKVEKTTEELNLELGAMLRSDTSTPPKPMLVVGATANGLRITEDNLAELVLERAKVMEIPLLKSGPMDGELGPVYGKQWRSWEGANGETFDQITAVINRLKTQPDCRRMIVSAWNVAEIGKMALAPCHCFFQFNTRPLKLRKRFNWINGYNSEEKAGVILKEFHALCKPDYGDETDPFKRQALWDIEADKVLDKIGVPKYYLDCHLYQR